jgi:hypothetical protein
MTKQQRLTTEQRLQSYASAWRMMLYLLMALVVLEIADVPSWATMPVFILFLCFDPGKTVVNLQEAGWGNAKIVVRLVFSVLPLAVVCAVAFAWYTQPIPTGIAALIALLFYIWDRQRLEKTAAGLNVATEEVVEEAAD